MLSLAHQHSLLPYVVALVAALSVQELFVEVNRPAEGEDEVKTTFKDPSSIKLFSSSHFIIIS